MFSGHWSSESGDKKYLICHVTSQDHKIEGSSNFRVAAFHGMSPLCQVL